TVALTPTAGEEENSVAAGTSSSRVRAAPTIAVAKGCSLSASAAAANAKMSSSVLSPTGWIPVTVGSPLVRVPVLSNSTASTVRMDSSARRSLINTPPRAARSVAIDTTNGIARPKAWGQAMTNTVIVRTTAASGAPSIDHTSAVSTAAPRANQNNQPAARSAMRWALDEEAWASATSFWIPASAVSSPMAVTSTRNPESVATVPATTASPSPRRTVLDSPVTMDSSMEALPSTIWPSAGTAAPGRTMNTSPTTSSAGATVTISSPSTFSATSGSKAARESNAEVVWARDRISIQWPNNI